MAAKSVYSYFSIAVGGFPIYGLTDFIDLVWIIWLFILGVKWWLITWFLLVMQKIVSWVLLLCRRTISTQQLWDPVNLLCCGIQLVSRGIILLRKWKNVWLCKCSPQTASNWWCEKSSVWTPRQYRWTKAFASSRDEPVGVVLLWIYSFWCCSSLLVITDGWSRWLCPEMNLQ